MILLLSYKKREDISKGFFFLFLHYVSLFIAVGQKLSHFATNMPNVNNFSLKIFLKSNYMEFIFFIKLFESLVKIFYP